MFKDLFNEVGGQVDELRIACEKQEIYYKTMISSHEVTISQQTLRITNLERQLRLNMIDPIEYTGQEMVADNVETIVHLQEQLKEMDEYAQEGWDLAETYNLEIRNLELDIHTLESDMWDTKASGRGMVEYPFNPEGETLDTSVDVSAIYKEKYPSVFKPVPHPYTHPIREVPESGKVKVKN